MSTPEEVVEKEHVCPECAAIGISTSYEHAMHLGLHRKREHGIEGSTPKRASTTRKPRRAVGDPRPGSLRGKIKDAVLMTASVTAIADPNIYVAVEATVDEFATAWDNVARQSPTARKYIEGLLVGGVWITAVGATIVMVVTVVAVTGKLPPALHPLGHFCVGKAGIQIQPVPPAHTNGGEPAGPQGTADQ